MEPKSYIGLKAWGFGVDAHLTLLYTGDLSPEQEEATQELVSRVVNSAFYSIATRVGFDLFGPQLNIPVLKVSVLDEVYALREYFIENGVPNGSEFGFNPHITLNLREIL